MRDPLSWVPVKFKLPLTFVSICLVAFGVGGFVVTSTAQGALRKEIQSRLDERAAAARLLVRHHLDLVGRRAEDFASDGFIRTSLEALVSGDAGARKPLRDHLVANKLPLVEAFVDAAVLGPDGTPLLQVHGGATGAAAAGTSYTPLLPAGGPRDYPSFAVSTPLKNLAGDRRIGTLVLQVQADLWVRRMTERAKAGTAVLLRSGGAELDLAGAAFPADSISYTSTIPESGWTMVVAADRAAITGQTKKLRDRFVSIAGVLLVVTAFVLFFPMRFLLRPLGRIREAARRIAAGDFSVRVGYNSKDEIGDLSRAFDIMAQAVEERTRELQGREAAIRLERDRLDVVIRSMRDSLFSIGEDGEVTFANEAARPLVAALKRSGGLTADRCLHSEGADCMRCLRGAVLPRGACTLEVEDRVYEVHVSPLPGGGGRLCVGRDVTERVAQAKVQAHQERMNVLGNISAVMAHELNNPLAAIAMFSQMLETQLDPGTPSHEAAEVITRNAETCKRTIRGLLDTAVHAPPERVEFDLDELVDDIRRFLRPILEPRRRRVPHRSSAARSRSRARRRRAPDPPGPHQSRHERGAGDGATAGIVDRRDRRATSGDSFTDRREATAAPAFPDDAAPAHRVRPVLHDQAAQRGDRARPLDVAPHHCRARRPPRALRKPAPHGTTFRVILLPEAAAPVEADACLISPGNRSNARSS